MSTLRAEPQIAFAEGVATTSEMLTIGLKDGREVSVPLAWYPRLLNASPSERQNWRLIGEGEGVHWPDLDEDISVQSLILGRPSGESQQSLRSWLASRQPEA